MAFSAGGDVLAGVPRRFPRPGVPDPPGPRRSHGSAAIVSGETPSRACRVVAGGELAERGEGASGGLLRGRPGGGRGVEAG